MKTIVTTIQIVEITTRKATTKQNPNIQIGGNMNVRCTSIKKNM